MNKYNYISRIFLQTPIMLLLLFFSFLYLNLYYGVALLNNHNSIHEVGTLVNLHDHNIYVKELNGLNNEQIKYEMNNDFGIAFIFHVLYVKTGISNLFDIYVFSILFNLFFLLLSFVFYNKICSKHKLSDGACLLFFFNFSLVYFVQLINKDMITIFILLYSLYFSIKGKYKYIIVILPLAFLVRQQLALCLITFLFLLKAKRTLFWIVVAYIVSSMAAGYISANLNLISQQSMGSGFSSYLMKLNSQYYVGNLLLNPVRVLQYFLSVPQSLIYTINNGKLDLAALLRALTLPLSLMAFSFLFYSLRNVRSVISTCGREYFLLTYSFFLCWLLNPTINSRYLMLIIPVMVLGYSYQSKYLGKDE